MKYLVVTGNPVDGLRFTGPFGSLDQAHKYAKGIRDTDWWVAGLDAPDLT